MAVTLVEKVEGEKQKIDVNAKIDILEKQVSLRFNVSVMKSK